MTSEEIKSLRKRLKYSQQELADKLGVGRATIARWELCKAKPSQLAERQLKRLERKNALNDAGAGVQSQEVKLK